MNIEIREARLGDEKCFARIQTESWKAAFRHILTPEELAQCTQLEAAEEMYRRVLAGGKIHLALELVEGEPHCIAAWGMNRCNQGTHTAELICIHSLPNHWHQGYGSQMMTHVLENMTEEGFSKVILWVFEENQQARRFYEKHGFSSTPALNLSHGAWERMYQKQL